MVCERCGSEIEDSASKCSNCGLVITRARNASHQHTNYGQYPQSVFGEGISPQRDYQPQAFAQPSRDYVPPQQREYMGYRQRAAEHLAAQPHNYQANTSSIPPNGGAIFTNMNNGALIAEIIFSLIGLYGIGWIIAGETTIGIILLLCSIFIYWPIMIFGTIFTVGIGLLCLGPIAIGGIIINTLALNAVLNKKASSFFVPHKPQAPGTHGPHRR